MPKDTNLVKKVISTVEEVIKSTSTKLMVHRPPVAPLLPEALQLPISLQLPVQSFKTGVGKSGNLKGQLQVKQANAPLNKTTTYEDEIKLLRETVIGGSTKYEPSELAKGMNPQNKTILTLTSHPTHLGLGNFYDENGKIRPPKVWEEAKIYYRKYIPKIAKSEAFDQLYGLQTWIGGYDNDRPPEHVPNTLTYAQLQNMWGCMIANGVSEDSPIIKKIDEITDQLEKSFVKKVTINVTEQLEKLSLLIDQEAPQQNIRVLPIRGISAQLRISSSALEKQVDIAQTSAYFKEVARNNKIFKADLVPDIIIADCTTVKQMTDVRELMREADLRANIVPLIEDAMTLDQMIQLARESDTTIMIANSDSIQRIGYPATVALTHKAHLAVAKVNKERALQGDERILHIEHGTGSTFARRGRNVERRVSTYVGDWVHRTVQGEEVKALLTNPPYAKHYIDAAINTQTASLDDYEKVSHVFEFMIENVSWPQFEIQEEPGFTANFDVKEMVGHLNVGPHGGSRSKDHTENKLKVGGIKNERAITQSNIFSHMGVQYEGLVAPVIVKPEALATLKSYIVQHIDNVYIQDLLDQLVGINQMMHLEQARKYIKNPVFMKMYESSFVENRRFLEGIQKELLPYRANLPKNLLIWDLDNHTVRYGFEHAGELPVHHTKTYEPSSEAYKELHKIIGKGVSTQKSNGTPIPPSAEEKPIFRGPSI